MYKTEHLKIFSPVGDPAILYMQPPTRMNHTGNQHNMNANKQKNWYTMRTVLSDQTSDFSEVQGKCSCPWLLLGICFSVGFTLHRYNYKGNELAQYSVK